MGGEPSSHSRATDGRRIEAPALVLLLLLLLVGVRFAAPARAAAGCPGFITEDTTLTKDIVAQPDGPAECVRFGAGGITLDLNGKTIDIRPLGMRGKAIVIVGVSDVRVTGAGTVKTTYDDPTLSPRAVRVQSSSNVSIRHVKVFNLYPSDEPVPPNRRVGRGIELDRVAGARLAANEIAFYGRGIYVLNSDGAPNYETIGSNRAHDNTSDAARSFGIGLLGSNGWNVTGNVVRGNGSRVNRQGGIEIQTGSNDNTVAGNFVVRNLGGGIQVDEGSSNNTIGNNDARHNGGPDALPDLEDANPEPSPNTWRKSNRCHFEAGSVPAHVCNPGE